MPSVKIKADGLRINGFYFFKKIESNGQYIATRDNTQVFTSPSRIIVSFPEKDLPSSLPKADDILPGEITQEDVTLELAEENANKFRQYILDDPVLKDRYSFADSIYTMVQGLLLNKKTEKEIHTAVTSEITKLGIKPPLSLPPLEVHILNPVFALKAAAASPPRTPPKASAASASASAFTSMPNPLAAASKAAPAPASAAASASKAASTGITNPLAAALRKGGRRRARKTRKSKHIKKTRKQKRRHH
jgi:hypothetical protein